VYVCMYVLRVYVCMSVCVCARARVCVYVCMYVCLCVYVFTYACMYACVCMYMYIYIYIYIYIHTHTLSDCVDTVYELLLLPNNNAVKHFYTNRSGVKCSLDIYRCGAGLAVTGPIHDIGQNIIQSSFQTGSSSSGHIYFLTAFLEEDFIRNIIQTLIV